MIKQLLEFDSVKDIVFNDNPLSSNNNTFYICGIIHYCDLFKNSSKDLIHFDLVTDSKLIQTGLILHVFGKPIYIINYLQVNKQPFKVKKFETDLEIIEATKILKDYINSDIKDKDFSEYQIDSFVRLKIFK